MTFVSLVSSNALIFSLFFGISLGASIFVLVCVRETKGLSIYGSPYFKEHVAMGKVLSQTFSLSFSLSFSLFLICVNVHRVRSLHESRCDILTADASCPCSYVSHSLCVSRAYVGVTLRDTP